MSTKAKKRAKKVAKKVARKVVRKLAKPCPPCPKLTPFSAIATGQRFQGPRTGNILVKNADGTATIQTLGPNNGQGHVNKVVRIKSQSLMLA